MKESYTNKPSAKNGKKKTASNSVKLNGFKPEVPTDTGTSRKQTNNQKELGKNWINRSRRFSTKKKEKLDLG